MQLTVLGGAAACPNPGQGSSSYLLQTDGSNYLIDCGPNTLQELRKHMEIDEIHRILISHVHADHTVDLVPLRYGLKYAPGLKTTRPILTMPPGGKAFLSGVASAFAMGSEAPDGFFDEVFQVQEYDPKLGLDDRGNQITFLRTNHPVPCWAMRIQTASRALVYLADSGPHEGLVDFARGADILICEGTYPVHEDVADLGERPHLSAFEAGQIARDAGVNQFILTHLWATAGLDRYEQESVDGFGGDVMIAIPGLIISTD